MRRILLDTGPLVALLDRSEKNHQRCIQFLQAFSGVFLSTEPVLTEALYLLSDSVIYQRSCIEFIMRGEVQLVPSSYQSLRRTIDLMETYRDTPMDFADATLVVLAEESHIHEIFTLDRRGFETYRLPKKKAFTIFP